MGIGPNGHWTKWVLDQMGLDQLGLDEMGIGPNGFRRNGNKPLYHLQYQDCEFDMDLK